MAIKASAKVKLFKLMNRTFEIISKDQDFEPEETLRFFASYLIRMAEFEKEIKEGRS